MVFIVMNAYMGPLFCGWYQNRYIIAVGGSSSHGPSPSASPDNSSGSLLKIRGRALAVLLFETVFELFRSLQIVAIGFSTDRISNTPYAWVPEH
jgi:hypothetical protein